MNDYLNQLQQVMQFYDQNSPGPLVTGPGGDSTSAWNEKLKQMNALRFAQQGAAMGSGGGYQAPPDFFNFGRPSPAFQPQMPPQGPGRPISFQPGQVAPLNAISLAVKRY